MNLPPFQQLVDSHWRDVARLAHALAGPEAGDDVAQQAWTQALAAYPRLTNATNLRGWLLTITHHCAMDHHRVRRRTTPHDDPEVFDRPTTTVAAQPDPQLWARVDALPARQRDVVALRFVGDLDHAAIAAILDISPANSRRLLADALVTLRLDKESLR